MAFLIVFIGLWTLLNVQATEFQIGGTIELQCNVTASFTWYKWMKPGSVIAEYRNNKLTTSDPRVSVSSSPTDDNLRVLVIREISSHDSGQYTCTVYFKNDRPPSETEFNVNVVASTSTTTSTERNTDYVSTNPQKTTESGPKNGGTNQQCSYVNFLFLFFLNMNWVSINIYL